MVGADRISYEDDLVNPFNRSCWRDLEGPIIPKTAGLGAPSLTTYRGNIRDFAFAAGDDYDCKWHIPHDYKLGSAMFIHLHWSHNGTNIADSLTITYYLSYAKGHQQAEWHAQKTLVHTVSGLTITNSPQYHHRVDEIQMTVAGGSDSMIDHDIIEPDGMILCHFDVTAIPTITGGAAKPFVHYVDIHYQADRVGTRRRAPDFYVD